MEIKRTTKWDGKMKALHFEGNTLIDENGEIVDLIKHLQSAYEDKYFDLSTTSKEEEIIEVKANSDDED